MSYNVSVIVPYKPDGGYREWDWHWCWRWWQSLTPYDVEICIGSDDSPQFNRSRARNNAFEKSTGDILVIADADTVVDNNAINNAISDVHKGESPWCIPYETYYNLSQEYTDYLHGMEKLSPISTISSNFSYEHKILSWAGMLVLPREAYDKMGGYDERFEGWGFEDNAFHVKLDNEWGKHTRRPGNAYHLWHPIKPDETFNSPQERKNRKLFYQEYATKYKWKDERIK